MNSGSQRPSVMNAEKTKQYYDHLTDKDICRCAYCQNYVRKIRSAYPKLAGFLDGMGVNIEKPFEAIPVGFVNEMMLYSGVQYVIIGSADDFRQVSIDNADIFITDSHPMTDVKEDHFVIEISPVLLKQTGEEPDDM